jgi:molybdopterin-guanine dinucleotide biosynthesis protein A
VDNIQKQVPTRPGISGLILAGGQSLRMGTDKGLVSLQGRPMIVHVYERFAPQVTQVLISANRNQETYANYGEDVIADPDDLEPWQGPLAGVLAGMRRCEAEWIATTPCDTPWLPGDLIARLCEALRDSDAQVAVACTPEQRHATCMLARTTLAPDILQYLRDGNRRVDAWQDRVGAVEVLFDTTYGFANVNSREDLTETSPF